MEMRDAIIYGVFGLISIIGYFLQDKLTMYEQRLNKLETQLNAHSKEDNDLHMKMLELYVTKADYTETVGRIFNMLTGISEDIKGLLTNKVDK